MTTKQRNFFIICGAVLVAWYVHGWIADMERQAAFRHQQAIRAQQRQQAKPKPAVPAAKKPPLQRGRHPCPLPMPPQARLRRLSLLNLPRPMPNLRASGAGKQRLRDGASVACASS